MAGWLDADDIEVKGAAAKTNWGKPQVDMTDDNTKEVDASKMALTKIDTLLTVDSEKFRELMWSWIAGTNLKVNLFPLIAIGGALFLCKFQI